MLNRSHQNRFEKWVLEPDELPEPRSLDNLGSARKANLAINEAINSHPVTIKSDGEHAYAADLRLPAANSFRPFDSDGPFPIFNLTLNGEAHSQIAGGFFHQIDIRSFQPSVSLSGCAIANLQLLSNRPPLSLRLTDCWVGNLTLLGESLSHLEVVRGAILNIKCPLPGRENPFAGDVKIAHSVHLPTHNTENSVFQGPQSYRSMRSHLEENQNWPMASLMRSKELSAERQLDTGLTKLVSWFYWIAANYGTSPGRPILWLVAAYIICALAIWQFDGGGALGLPETAYTGWRAILLDENLGPVARSLLLPLQSLLSPFGGLGVRRLIVAATSCGSVILVIQGILSVLLLFLSGISIRRRFRMT